MYDHMFSRSFSKNEQKRFMNCAFVICIFVAFTLCTVFRPNFHLSISDMQVGGQYVAVVSPSRVEERVSRKDGKMIPNPEPLSVSRAEQNESRSLGSMPLRKPASIPPSTSRNGSFEDTREGDPSIDCRFSEAVSDYCEIKGIIRVHGRSSTIFTTNFGGNKSWVIRPYARKGSDAMKWVREWTIKGVEGQEPPRCETVHPDPAILFSTGGFCGNYFHAFTDILIPLFTNSRGFNREVHLLVTNYKKWWISKFEKVLNQLSEHPVVDIDNDDRVRCFQNAIIGFRWHKELGIDPLKSRNAYSMDHFRDFLRSTYDLERKVVIKLNPNPNPNETLKLLRPRLMIVSRKHTRKLTNEASIVKTAKKIGFDVIVANVSHSTNLSSLARVVNSCDVFMGVHGAGMTNMVFLPDNAVVIQVVPLGGIEGFAETDFGEPSKAMKLRYLKYGIRVKESSLARQYEANDVVLKDPRVIHRQGWDAIRVTYLEKQNIKVDVRRFRSTLLKAFKYLHQ